MKTQFGKQNLISLTAGKKNGLGMVVAKGYRVVACADRPASERLSSDCRSALRLRALDRDRLALPSWQGPSSSSTPTQGDTTTVDPAVATSLAMPAMDHRLPAPVWAAFVLNHALCG